MTEIVEYSPTEAALAELRTRYGNAKYDVTTTAGMTDAKKARAELRKCRTTLEEKRVEIKSPALERCRLIDAEAKRITAEIEALEDPIHGQIWAEEERKEREKQAAELAKRALLETAQRQCNDLRNVVVQSVGQTSEFIARLITQVKAFNVPDNEHAGDVNTVRAQTLTQLDGMYQQALARAAEAKKLENELADLARLRAEAAKQQAKADADAAAERAKIEAENRKAAQERAALEAKAAAERKAADDAAAKARAEQDRLAAAERAKEEAKLRAERAKMDAERDAAEALAKRQREEAEAKVRAEQEAAAKKAHAAEAEKIRKASGRQLLQTFVEKFGADEEFSAVARYVKEFLDGQGKAKKRGAA